MDFIGVQCQMSNLFISVKINLVGPDAKTPSGSFKALKTYENPNLTLLKSVGKMFLA